MFVPSQIVKLDYLCLKKVANASCWNVRRGHNAIFKKHEQQGSESTPDSSCAMA
jgi:hypothetical protein